MSEETARAERRLHAQGIGRQQGRAHHVLRRRDAAELPGAEADDRLRAPARRRARQGRRLQPDDQRDAAASRRSSSSSPRTQVGVTISIDGPQEVQDKFRVFHNGTGSYDIVAPKIKELLDAASQPADRRARHADVGQTLDVARIYQHLTEEIGFWEVGFAPVTTSPDRELRDRRATASTRCSAQFHDARRRVPRGGASPNRHHGFSNVQGHARGDSQGHEQGVSRAAPASG